MFAKQPDLHEMVLEVIHPSGAEEWYCPACGQRFLLQWPPAHKKVMLQAGNPLALHSGGKANGDCDQLKSIPTDETFSSGKERVLSEEEQRRLEQWKQWLDEIGFENRWEN